MAAIKPSMMILVAKAFEKFIIVSIFIFDKVKRVNLVSNLDLKNVSESSERFKGLKDRYAALR